MPQYDAETYGRAKALIHDLVEAGLLPKASGDEPHLACRNIVLKHIALAEGKNPQ